MINFLMRRVLCARSVTGRRGGDGEFYFSSPGVREGRTSESESSEVDFLVVLFNDCMIQIDGFCTRVLLPPVPVVAPCSLCCCLFPCVLSFDASLVPCLISTRLEDGQGLSRYPFAQ